MVCVSPLFSHSAGLGAPHVTERSLPHLISSGFVSLFPTTLDPPPQSRGDLRPASRLIELFSRSTDCLAGNSANSSADSGSSLLPALATSCSGLSEQPGVLTLKDLSNQPDGATEQKPLLHSPRSVLKALPQIGLVFIFNPWPYSYQCPGL